MDDPYERDYYNQMDARYSDRMRELYNERDISYGPSSSFLTRPLPLPSASRYATDRVQRAAPPEDSVKDVLDFARRLRKDDHDGQYSTVPQRRAIRLLRSIMDKMDPSSRVHSSRKLRKLFSCLDTSIFQSRLRNHCRLVFDKLGSKSLHGCTRAIYHCKRHQWIKRIEIHIDTNHRFCDAVETLIHEMCHAFIRIYLDSSKLSCFDNVVHRGKGGHSDLWQELFRSCAEFLLHNVEDHVTIDVEEHLHHDKAENREQRQKIRRIFQDTLQLIPARDMTYMSLSRALRLQRGDQDDLLNLIEEGRDILEIIVLMVFPGDDRDDWRRPTPRRGNPRSAIVEGLDDGYSKFLLSNL